MSNTIILYRLPAFLFLFIVEYDYLAKQMNLTIFPNAIIINRFEFSLKKKIEKK